MVYYFKLNGSGAPAILVKRLPELVYRRRARGFYCKSVENSACN
jgi:hypothetical protein